VQAQAYPAKPVRVVVGFSPGGIADVTVRQVAPRLSDALGQQIIVENRPGASGAIATERVALSPADGYTLLAPTAADAVIPLMRARLPYHLERDLAPVSLLAVAPFVLVVHPSVPARNVKELIALAKAKPGALNYGSAGNGSDNHLTAEVFKHAAKIDVLHVPYKGGGAVMLDLVAGQVAFVFSTIPTAHPFISSGRLRPLAVSGAKRNTAYPEVPTVAETIPGFNVNAWLGLLGPAGIPGNATDRLYAATARALQRPDVTKRLAAMGAEVVGSTPAQMGAHLKSEMDRWVNLAKQVKFEVVD
jgi:tripartite-type tricarboxylate transporter receptor subunit TctC